MDYKVVIGFCGFVGVENTYYVDANDTDEAVELALNEASYDLDAEVEDLGDGEYDVTVNFGGYVGADETYNVDATDEDDAIKVAMAQALDDLTVESVNGEEY